MLKCLLHRMMSCIGNLSFSPILQVSQTSLLPENFLSKTCVVDLCAAVWNSSSSDCSSQRHIEQSFIPSKQSVWLQQAIRQWTATGGRYKIIKITHPIPSPAHSIHTDALTLTEHTAMADNAGQPTNTPDRSAMTKSNTPQQSADTAKKEDCFPATTKAEVNASKPVLDAASSKESSPCIRPTIIGIYRIAGVGKLISAIS